MMMRWRLVVILPGAVVAALLILRLTGPTIDGDDFAADYAAAQSLLAGANPYAEPVGSLMGEYVARKPGRIYSGHFYAIPHPPFALMLAAPLARYFPYRTARSIWLALDVALLVAIGAFCVGPRHCWWVALALVAWTPLATELRWGNWSLILAALTVAAWHWRHRPALAGALLGFATSIKLYPALLIGFFALSRRWGVAAWAIAVAVGSTLWPALAYPGLLMAYLNTAQQAPGALFTWPENYSVLAGITRLFGGVQYLLPSLAVGTAVALVLYLVAIEAKHDDDGAFAAALCASVVLAPLAWSSYLCLLTWPVAIAGRELHSRGLPRGATRVLLAIIALISTPPRAITYLADKAGVARPFVLLLLPAGPIALLGFLVYLRRQPAAVINVPATSTAMA
jgi:uncharacterized membrane protein